MIALVLVGTEEIRLLRKCRGLDGEAETNLATRGPSHTHYGLKGIPVSSVGVFNPRGCTLLILSLRPRTNSDLWVFRILKGTQS